MDIRTSKSKKNIIKTLMIWGLLMLALMINDAINHPEDFKKGRDAARLSNHSFIK